MAEPGTMTIKLKDFPMPPSVNNLYFTTKFGKRVKAKGYTDFERASANWAKMNTVNLGLVRQMSLECRTGWGLRVDQTFYFPQGEILTKQGKPKRNDTTNRLKALHDVLSKLLGIDDCWFWNGVYDKKISPVPDLPAYCEVTFRLIQIY